MRESFTWEVAPLRGAERRLTVDVFELGGKKPESFPSRKRNAIISGR